MKKTCKGEKETKPVMVRKKKLTEETKPVRVRKKKLTEEGNRFRMGPKETLTVIPSFTRLLFILTYT